jgi:thiol-disulfide isomerase/thioredoxin
MPTVRQGLFALLALLAAGGAFADHVNIRPFDADSMAAIRAEYAGKPFVLAFWSTTCEPCRREMTLWRAMKLRHPQIPIVLVAAEAPSDGAAVKDFLRRYNPGPVRHWLFADEYVERVRYSVDKSWRGELPRTYFFDAAHTAEAYSGLLERSRVEQWFKRNTPPRRASLNASAPPP